MAVGGIAEAIGHTAQLKLGDILEAKHLTVGRRTDHYLAELLRRDLAAAVAHGVLEALVTLLAEGTGRGLDVLLGKGGGHVRRHEIVLRHHIGLQPYAHRIVGAEAHHIAHSAYALQLRHDVYLQIVVEKLRTIRVGSVHKSHTHEHRRLALLCQHSHLIYL